jgi:hypothetical protein
MQHTPRSGHQCDREKAATPTHHERKGQRKPRGRRSRGRVPAGGHAPLTATAQLSTACCDMLRRPCGNETLRPCRESRARGAYSVHVSASAPDKLVAPVSGRPAGKRSAGCQQDGSHALKRPMTAQAAEPLDTVHTGSAATSCSRIQSRAYPGGCMQRAPVKGASPSRSLRHQLTSHASPEDSASPVFRRVTGRDNGASAR